jgi:hypothetical protein
MLHFAFEEGQRSLYPGVENLSLGTPFLLVADLVLVALQYTICENAIGIAQG